jgi:hypothetical protein
MLAAVQGPRPPGPETLEARSLINRNLVAAKQAVQEIFGRSLVLEPP